MGIVIRNGELVANITWTSYFVDQCTIIVLDFKRIIQFVVLGPTNFS